MIKKLKLALLLVCSQPLLGACRPDGAESLEQRFFAMGTWVDIAIDAEESAATGPVLAEIEAFLRRFERDYYAWADGELARVNAALGEARSISVSAEMAALLARAQQLSSLTMGTFDPAVGGLVELWGFHSGTEIAAEPAHEAIRAWLAAAPSIAELRIFDGTVSSANPAVKLDLGGIAKGAAVDRMLQLLRDADIGNALVNAGGDVRAIGRRRDRHWRIGIQAPRSSGILGVIELQDGEAVFTSGDYERYFDSDGRRMHHLLDPRTGYPASETQAVTVLATDGVTADAAATAVFVAGRAHWREVAADLNLDAVLRVDESGSVEMTAAMRRRLERSATDQRDTEVPR